MNFIKYILPVIGLGMAVTACDTDIESIPVEEVNPAYTIPT